MKKTHLPFLLSASILSLFFLAPTDQSWGSSYAASDTSGISIGYAGGGHGRMYFTIGYGHLYGHGDGYRQYAKFYRDKRHIHKHHHRGLHGKRYIHKHSGKGYYGKKYGYRGHYNGYHGKRYGYRNHGGYYYGKKYGYGYPSKSYRYYYRKCY